MKITKYSVFLAFIFLSGCTKNIKVFSKGDIEQIVSEGTASYISGDVSLAKSKALLDAQKNAIEEFIQLFLSDEIKASKYSVVEEKILNSPQVYVKKYKILDEFKINNNYRVKITAYVMIDRLKVAIKDLGLIGQSAKFMKGILVLKESENDSALSFNDAYHGIKNVFEKGIDMELIGYLPGDFKKADLKTQTSILETARNLGAQFLFLAESDSSKLIETSQIQTGFVPYRSKIKLKIFDLDSNKSVMELSTQANSIDSSEELARKKALYSAGELMGQELTKTIARIIKGVAPTKIRIKSLCGIEKIKNFRNVLFAMKNTNKVLLEDYSHGEALFSVWTNINTLEEFASRIIKESPVPLELESIYHSEIIFEVTQ